MQQIDISGEVGVHHPLKNSVDSNFGKDLSVSVYGLLIVCVLVKQRKQR